MSAGSVQRVTMRLMVAVIFMDSSELLGGGPNNDFIDFTSAGSGDHHYFVDIRHPDLFPFCGFKGSGHRFLSFLSTTIGRALRHCERRCLLPEDTQKLMWKRLWNCGIFATLLLSPRPRTSPAPR